MFDTFQLKSHSQYQLGTHLCCLFLVSWQDVCVSLFSRDRFAKVKVSTFPVLTKVSQSYAFFKVT